MFIRLIIRVLSSARIPCNQCRNYTPLHLCAKLTFLSNIHILVRPYNFCFDHAMSLSTNLIHNSTFPQCESKAQICSFAVWNARCFQAWVRNKLLICKFLMSFLPHSWAQVGQFQINRVSSNPLSNDPRSWVQFGRFQFGIRLFTNQN